MTPQLLSRRDFLSVTGTMAGALAAGLPLTTGKAAAVAAQPAGPFPFVVFSKVYQELKLDYDDSARVTAEAGLDGVDATVRPGGEVLPERVTDDLPKYVEALRRRKLQMPLMATAITGPRSPHAETILRTGRRLGVRFYRLGPKHIETDTPLPDQLRQIKADLKELAALNKEIGITGVLQNHSPSGRNTYAGGDLAQMRELLDGLDPAHLGLVFDIGHALVVHGDQWSKSFEPLKPNLRLIYVKDVKRPAQWLPIGQGEIRQTGFFDYIKKHNGSAPVSIHVEYPWHQAGAKDPATLAQALNRDLTTLRRWMI